MMTNFEKYNKFWGALVPVVAWFIQEYLGANVSADQVSQWSNDMILLLSPVFAYWMTNKTE